MEWFIYSGANHRNKNDENVACQNLGLKSIGGMKKHPTEGLRMSADAF